MGLHPGIYWRPQPFTAFDKREGKGLGSSQGSTYLGIAMSIVEKLNAILAEHAATRVNGKVASERTHTAAKESLRASFRQLGELGYRLEDPRNLAEKHIKALCRHWYENKRAPKTMQGNLSHLRICCGWIGKSNLVKGIGHYLPEVPAAELRVSAVARKSKSWAELGIDVREKVEEADALDWRFGLMIRAMVAFGLRRMEVLQMIPWKVDKGDKFAVYEAKGGRPRDVYITTEVQRQVLDQIKARIKTKTAPLGWAKRPDGKVASLKYSERRYNYLMAKIGITKEHSKAVGHGLRAQFAENAALIVNMLPPTLGGTGGQMPREELDLLRTGVSELLGHSRIGVTPAYYGSFGREGTPDAPEKARTAIEEGIALLPVDGLAGVSSVRRGDCLKLSGELAEAEIYIDLRHVNALWERHSARHNTDWLAPTAQSNLAAIEAAATSLVRAQPDD